MKGQRSTLQMTAFLIHEKIITDKKQLFDMWADHFEALGTLSVSAQYDNDFFTRIATSVKDIFTSCIEDPSGVLNEPLQYDEAECVCSQFTPGVNGASIDYEHINISDLLGKICGFHCISCSKTSLKNSQFVMI